MDMQTTEVAAEARDRAETPDLESDRAAAEQAIAAVDLAGQPSATIPTRARPRSHEDARPVATFDDIAQPVAADKVVTVAEARALVAEPLPAYAGIAPITEATTWAEAKALLLANADGDPEVAKALDLVPEPPAPPKVLTAAAAYDYVVASNDWLEREINSEILGDEAVNVSVDVSLRLAEEAMASAPCVTPEDILAKARCIVFYAQTRMGDLSGEERLLKDVEAGLTAMINPAPTGLLATLVAEHRALLDEINASTDYSEEADRANEQRLSDSYTAIDQAPVRNIDDLFALITYLKAEEDDDPNGVSFYCGKRPVQLIYDRAAALVPTQRPNDDDELAGLGQKFVALRERLSAIDQSDDEGANEAEAVTEAMDPLVQCAKQITSKGLAGLLVKAEMADQFLPVRGSLESTDLGTQLAHSLIDDLRATADGAMLTTPLALLERT